MLTAGGGGAEWQPAPGSPAGPARSTGFLPAGWGVSDRTGGDWPGALSPAPELGKESTSKPRFPESRCGVLSEHHSRGAQGDNSHPSNSLHAPTGGAVLPKHRGSHHLAPTLPSPSLGPRGRSSGQWLQVMALLSPGPACSPGALAGPWALSCLAVRTGDSWGPVSGGLVGSLHSPGVRRQLGGLYTQDKARPRRGRQPRETAQSPALSSTPARPALFNSSRNLGCRRRLKQRPPDAWKSALVRVELISENQSKEKY